MESLKRVSEATGSEQSLVFNVMVTQCQYQVKKKKANESFSPTLRGIFCFLIITQ